MNDSKQKNLLAVKKYQATHPEKMREYLERTKEKRHNKRIEYIHSPRGKSVRDTYNKDHKEEISEYHKNYNKTHKEAHRHNTEVRRARKRGAGGLHTLQEWEILKAQYNWTCPCCHRREPEIILTEDHIIPLSKGGSNNIENIQPLCRPCNSKKHTNIIFYG